MKGIDFVVDPKGRRKAVVIDLATHSSLWEDIWDALVAEKRAREPRIEFAEVKRELKGA